MDKLLIQFLAVAEAGSISGAATALFVTQPTLTINMRKLEETMGVPLLTRSSRGVELTPYGETLYQNASLMRRLYDNTLGRSSSSTGARARYIHRLRIFVVDAVYSRHGRRVFGSTSERAHSREPRQSVDAWTRCCPVTSRCSSRMRLRA